MKCKRLEITLQKDEIDKMKKEELGIALFEFQRQEYYLVGRIVKKPKEAKKK